jgi:preprotein translocase subunit SecB
VNSKALSDTDFEIELTVEGKADAAGTVLFSFELIYAGIFRLTHVPKDAVQPVMMIECPRLLFPYAREIVSSVVRNGGFPPLMIDPVDFVSLYRQKMAQTQQGAPAN